MIFLKEQSQARNNREKRDLNLKKWQGTSYAGHVGQ